MAEPSLAADSFDALYLSHHGHLRAWLRRRLGCPDRAADIAHDTFLRLLARPRAIDCERNPVGYLHTIARGLLIDDWRRRRIERAWRETLAQLPASQMPSPEHQAMVVETLHEIDVWLARMASRPRQAFILAQLHGMGQAQIAQQLQVSERMVRKYLAQAMLHCLLLDAEHREAMR